MYTIGGVLCHHGIQGQKWGKRNGPPYPLKPGDHSAAEKEAAKKGGKSSSSDNISKGKKPKQGSVLAALAVWGGMLLGEAVTMAALIAGSNAYTKHKTKKFRKEQENAETDKETGLKLKTKDLSEKEDLKRVNSEYYYLNKDRIGHTKNCVRCTAAYELRRRGYDVSAATADRGLDGEKFMQKLFGAKPAKGIPGYDKYPPDAELVYKAENGWNISAKKATKEVLSKEPKGSRGQILVQWDEYSGHSFIYQVNDKGKVEFLDAQKGIKLGEGYSSSYLSHSCYITYQRLDNCKTINKSMLKEAVNDYPDASKKKSGK